jgi:hypothetical protein
MGHWQRVFQWAPPARAGRPFYLTNDKPLLAVWTQLTRAVRKRDAVNVTQ